MDIAYVNDWVSKVEYLKPPHTPQKEMKESVLTRLKNKFSFFPYLKIDDLRF